MGVRKLLGEVKYGEMIGDKIMNTLTKDERNVASSMLAHDISNLDKVLVFADVVPVWICTKAIRVGIFITLVRRLYA